MTELRRLLDGDAVNDFERWLVQSAADERPGSTLTAQMRSSLGLSAVSVGARVSTISSLKLTLLAVTLGTLMGVHGSENRFLRQVGVPNTTKAQLVAQPVGELAHIPATIGAQSGDDQGDQALPTQIDSTLSLRGSKSTHPKEHSRLAERGRNASGPDLREEIRLLDLARTSIQRRQPEEALASLKTYTNRFSAGAFKQEASVLRMQALAQIGDVSRASSMAKQFVESNPNSPYVGHAARIAKSSKSFDSPQ